MPFTAAHGFLAHPQLLEDLDEQLSCTRLEEAAVSRRISSGGCPAQLLVRSGDGERFRADWGPFCATTWEPSTPTSPSVSFPLAGKASCWLNLNVELLREQFFAIRSKRRKLGKEPAGGRASPGRLGSLQLGTGNAGSLGACAP